ncbi:hypothetical protein GPALN_013340 [Globodera pallida]|nr:hypothetical protein GPALN_013338 [Globodera pallida]KAI3417393.1 hypothetical protein GPALN_013340 [Globodera pallida]
MRAMNESLNSVQVMVLAESEEQKLSDANKSAELKTQQQTIDDLQKTVAALNDIINKLPIYLSTLLSTCFVVSFWRQN